VYILLGGCLHLCTRDVPQYHRWLQCSEGESVAAAAVCGSEWQHHSNHTAYDTVSVHTALLTSTLPAPHNNCLQTSRQTPTGSLTNSTLTQFRRSLKTSLFGQWDHGAVWTLLTAPSRNILTCLLTLLHYTVFGGKKCPYIVLGKIPLYLFFYLQ